MGFAFRLMVIVLTFNIALGITAYLFGGSAMFMSSLDQNAAVSQGADFATRINTDTGTPVQDQSIWYRLIDIINLGFFTQIQPFLNATIYSIPTIIIFTYIGAFLIF